MVSRARLFMSDPFSQEWTMGLAPKGPRDNRRLMLIDMGQLMSMWIEHYDNLTELDKARLPLRPVYFLSPLD